MTTKAEQRLLADLKELQSQTIYNVSAQPLEGNLFKWHANLVGPGFIAFYQFSIFSYLFYYVDQ